MNHHLQMFCHYLYASSYLPIAYCLSDGTVKKSFPERSGNKHTVNRFITKDIQQMSIASDSHLSYFRSKITSASYGRLTFEHSDAFLIIGPVFEMRIKKETIRTFIDAYAMENSQEPELSAFLQSIPLMNQFQFINQLIFMNFCLNREENQVEQFIFDNTQESNTFTVTYLEKNMEIKENENFHNTYLLERTMYDYIKNGEKKKLKNYLAQVVKNQLISEGKLADNSLRQAKNIFLAAITKIGTLGAIPGGMDVEEAYQLMDLYCQECEKLSDITSIRKLNLVALEDFCDRVSLTRAPQNLSRETQLARSFIHNSTNKVIQVTDVAQAIDRSVSFISKRFKKEMGVSVGKYIMDRKLEEARHLLVHSEKSLAEISEYLCFSTQSYFQNAFKKKYGTTPKRCRNENKL